MDTQFLKSKDGLPIYLETHAPAGKPETLLVIVHGRGEHAGIFRHVVEYFTKRNYLVFLYDQRGHGKSGGRRSHVVDFQEYVNDLEMILEKARTYGLPIVLLSHSIGAMVTLLYLDQVGEKTPVQRVVMMGMPLISTVKAPWLKVKVGLLCAKILPILPFSTGIRPEDVTTNPVKMKERAEDPLYHHAITAGWYAAFLKAIEALKKPSYAVQVPALFLHGGNDRIMDPKGSQFTFDRYACTDKQIEILANRGHELHNEKDYEVILGKVDGWLREPLRSRLANRL